MKNLITCLIVAALVSTADAGFKISVNGVVDPPEPKIILVTGESAILGIVGDGQTSSPDGMYFIVEGPGTGEGGDSSRRTCFGS